MHIKMENIANVPIGENFSPTITIPIAKAKQIPNIKMEHSHSIINFNVTQKREKNTLIGQLITTMFLIY
jgi:hypothetical protein